LKPTARPTDGSCLQRLLSKWLDESGPLETTLEGHTGLPGLRDQSLDLSWRGEKSWSPFSPSKNPRPSGLGSFSVLAFLGLEMSQVLEDDDRRAVLPGELDDAATDPMRRVVDRADVAKQLRVVGLVLADHVSLGPLDR
jgi:hypothetical protein